MTVADEAIEAGAQAMYEGFRSAYMGRFDLTPTWDALGGDQQNEWRRHGRKAYEAMAPRLAALAWDDAIQRADDEGCLLYHEAKALKSLNPHSAAA